MHFGNAFVRFVLPNFKLNPRFCKKIRRHNILSNRLNTLNCSQSSGNCCDVAYLVLETSLADCLAVFGVVAFCLRSIDYKAHFLVHNTAGQGTFTLEALTQPFCELLKHYQPAIKSTTSGRPAPILFTTSHLIPFAL